jgi:hypothetical protein
MEDAELKQIIRDAAAYAKDAKSAARYKLTPKIEITLRARLGAAQYCIQRAINELHFRSQRSETEQS